MDINSNIYTNSDTYTSSITNSDTYTSSTTNSNTYISIEELCKKCKKK